MWLSEKTIFQVYAPNNLTKSETIRKIRTDFEGALRHWEGDFTTWVFLHNDPSGELSPHVIRTILELQQSYPHLTIEARGYHFLKTVFETLPLSSLEEWFGVPVTPETMRDFGFKDLQIVLTHISREPSISFSDIREVSPGKLEANGLSTDVQGILRLGMSKAPQVEKFFSRWHDPLFGEEIAQSFRAKYKQLKDENLHPDEIFGRLQRWAGGTSNSSPSHQVAVYAVLAYLFDSCQIFEDARDVSSS